MAESDSIKNAGEIKFKFCGICGRLLPSLPMYFNKSRNSMKQPVLYYACKKCQYNKKKDCERKNPKHYEKYRQEYRVKKRLEYLDSIGETEESLRAKKPKKKKQKTPTQRKADLKKKAAINTKKIKGKKRPAEIDIFGNKKCRKCGQWKHNDEENYPTRTDYQRQALNRICHECVLERKGAVIQKKSDMFRKLSKYEETRTDPKNKELGQCRCAYCGRWINPTYGAVRSRLRAFEKIGTGECRIYCEGDQCREACPTFKQQFYPKGFKVNSSREVDPAIRIMCMERDNWTCQRCEANDPDTILHAHHILSYKRNIMLANDIENVITMCKGCHNDIHKTEGCGYHELRC